MRNTAIADPAQARAAPIQFRLKAADLAGDIGYITGIATSPQPDRMGDVVEPMGAMFELPLPLLWQHDARQPIGKVVAAAVTADGIEIKAEIHKLTNGIRAQFDLVKDGLVPGLSIGFRDLEAAPLDPKNPFGGWRITQWEWLELSVVTIPANAAARITQVKRYTDRRALANAPVGAAGAAARTLPATTATVHPAPTKGTRPMPKYAAARIEALEIDAATHQRTIDEIMQACAAEQRDPDEEETAAIEVAQGLLEKAEGALTTYKSLEQAQAQKAANANGRGSTVVSFPAKKRMPGEIMVKAAMVQLFAHVDRSMGAEAHADRLFRNDNETVTAVKSIVNPAQTTVAGWAQELVREDIQGFLDLLKPTSLWRQLDARSADLNFNGAHSIKVPGRAATPTIPGGFIGEGGMIPVKRMGFTAQSIFRYKMAVISTFTREMLEQSTPNIEVLLRQAMADDTSVSIDAALLSTAPVIAGIKPAGLFVGMATSASAGNTLANIIADIRLMTAHVTGAYARDPVWIMNDQRVAGLALVTNATGQFMFKDELGNGMFMGYPVLHSTSVPANIVALVDAADFRSAFDPPGYTVSDQATIVEVDADDGTPPYIAENVVPPAGSITSVDDAVLSTPAGPVRSLFQTDTLALRMIMPLSWYQFRAANSYVLTGVNW